MKLAFVVSLWFPYGGMQRSLLRIAQECLRRGHSVDIYTGEWQGERPPDMGIFELDTRAATNYKSNDRLAERFRERADRLGYDCRVGFTKIPGLDVYYAADPCYAARVDETRPLIYKLTPRYRSLRRQEAAVFRQGADSELMLIAHRQKDKFMYYYDTEAERFHLLPPGINRQRLVSPEPNPKARDELRSELGLSAGEIMLIAVGSRFQTKGVDRLIRALAALTEDLRKRTRLVVVGSGKRTPLILLAKRLGVAERVVFAGNRDDIALFYYTADALVHAPRTENTGTVLLEAMVCGLPVLATSNCGFSFHVEAANAGMVCPGEPFSQIGLNAALQEFLLSPKRESWRDNGPRYCENTDIYGLVSCAADVIIDRARRNRERHAEHS